MSSRRLRSAAISLADWVAVRSRLASVIARRYGGIGTILMFHRIAADLREQVFLDSDYSQSGLDRLIGHFLRQGVAIVDMDEALMRLRKGASRRFVVFTFDDGYKDNLINALPVFQRHQVPFTVYVCTDVIERRLFYWWGGLVDLISRFDSVEFEALGRRLEFRTRADRLDALWTVSRWVGKDMTVRGAALAPTFARYGIAPGDLLDRDALTVSELRTLAGHPLVSIGGHSTTHRPLASLDPETAEPDIVANRCLLERETSAEIAHFAYPFGKARDCGWRDAGLVKQAGYRSAVSTRPGNLFPAHADYPFMLPRGTMNPMRENPFHADAQAAGIHRFIKSRGGAPIDGDTLPSGPDLPADM